MVVNQGTICIIHIYENFIKQRTQKKIAWMTWHSKEGHIPSAYSILDIIHFCIMIL